MATVPISPVYLNVQEARASAALPAAGAWDPTPTEMFCPYFDDLTLSLTYTRGALNGAFEFQLELSPYSVAANAPAGASEWVTQGIYAAGVTAAGADTTSLVERELQSHTSQGAAVEDFTFHFELEGGFERVRVQARETGVVLTPGTLQIQAVFA